MVTTSPTHRQASIRKFSCLLLLLAGCQTPPTTSPPAPLPPPAARGPVLENAKTLTPVVAAKSTPPPAVPSPTAQISTLPPTPLPTAPTPPSSRRAAELPDAIAGWRVAQISSHEWSLTPVNRPNLSDSPPSLMEDAIITSGIHARLQATASGRATTWKHSCNAGKVVLLSPELTTNQALAALRSISTLDKVVEIRLRTTLH